MVPGEPVISYDGKRVLIDGLTPDRDPVAQAKAEARFVRELLAESTGRRESSIPVQAVVLYPGWSVEPNSSGRAVWILNPKRSSHFSIARTNACPTRMWVCFIRDLECTIEATAAFPQCSPHRELPLM